MTPNAEYAAELEAMRKKADKGGRPSKKKPTQRIVEVKPHDRAEVERLSLAIPQQQRFGAMWCNLASVSTLGKPVLKPTNLG